MPVKITIIGLGQIGASIGLALSAHKDKVVTTGHDKEYGIEQRAKKLGVVNGTNHNLPSSVENADLVILALPVNEIRETFGYIAQDLRKDAVVMDTSPVKAEVTKWAEDILPQTAHYVGVVPAVGPAHLDLTGAGLDSAKVDLFEKGVFLVSTPPHTPGEAVNLVTDLIKLLGSTAILTDVTESDGLMASAYVLPRLTSVALLNGTMNQPGWAEMRKSASREYFAATAALLDSSTEGLAMLAEQDRANVIHHLNRLMNALLDLRDDLEHDDHASLLKRLKSAKEGRENWLVEREKADWSRIPGEEVEKPSFMESLLGSRLGKMGKRKDK
ncbi:MAG: prephenate dehydrogenase [Chloroflexi bacterium]|nr:prephenate dehydrogenase [Chloroflexota bacterium]MBI3166928.1 prephenate dehydrogenase [Chloroflexota bacterium]